MGEETEVPPKPGHVEGCPVQGVPPSAVSRYRMAMMCEVSQQTPDFELIKKRPRQSRGRGICYTIKHYDQLTVSVEMQVRVVGFCEMCSTPLEDAAQWLCWQSSTVMKDLPVGLAEASENEPIMRN